MNCPFCQQELVEIQFGEQRYWSCINDRCNESVGLGGNLKLWQELIRTRKALEVAKDRLKTVRRYTAINQFAPKSREAHIVAKKAVAEITALDRTKQITETKGIGVRI